MSLLTYEDARPRAKAIRDEVERRAHAAVARGRAGRHVPERAPADRRREEHAARAGRTAARRRAIRRTCRRRRVYAEGWAIGQAGRRLRDGGGVQGSGRGRRSSTSTSTSRRTSPSRSGSRRSKMRPGNREVVHHVLVYYKAQAGHAARAGAAAAIRSRCALPPPTRRARARERERSQTPGAPAGDLRARHESAGLRPGTALRLEPGGVIELQMHYTANGEAATDRTKVGLIFAKDPAPREVRVTPVLQRRRSMLPAGAADVAVDAESRSCRTPRLGHLPAHAPARQEVGVRARAARRHEEDRSSRCRRYDFNWQTYYMFKEPLQVPEGLAISSSSAWYDNSAANKSNPDPKVDVKWGDQTWEEMQYTGLLFSPAVRQPTPTAGGRIDQVNRSRLGRPLRSPQPRVASSQRPFGSASSPAPRSAVGRARSHQDPRHLDWRNRPHRSGALRGLPLAGGRGTMSLTTYEEARPWARAIKEEVLTRRMPKWHAVRGYGDFTNDPSLSPFESRSCRPGLTVARQKGPRLISAKQRRLAVRRRTEELPAARGMSPSRVASSRTRGHCCWPSGRNSSRDGTAGIAVKLPDGRRRDRRLDSWLRPAVSDDLSACAFRSCSPRRRSSAPSRRRRAARLTLTVRPP